VSGWGSWLDRLVGRPDQLFERFGIPRAVWRRAGRARVEESRGVELFGQGLAPVQIELAVCSEGG